MGVSKTKNILMITLLVICCLFNKIDGFAEQALIPDNKLESTYDYNESIIENQYEENIRIYGEGYTDILLSEILGFDINNIEEANKDKWYYYNRLDEEQKRVYESVLINAIRQQKYTFSISGFTKDDIWNFLKYIQYDHEKTFWIDWNAPSSLKYNTGSGEFVFTGQAYEQFKTTKDIYKAWCQIKNYKEMVLGNTEQLDKRQIEKRIYSYIATNTIYNINATMDQSLYSTVLGETVCTGYAKMFKYLCNEAGIDCICIFGQFKGGGYHLWNVVSLYDQLYMVDCTCASAVYKENVYVLYNYLNNTIDYMDEYYIVSDYFKIGR